MKHKAVIVHSALMYLLLAPRAESKAMQDFLPRGIGGSGGDGKQRSDRTAFLRLPASTKTEISCNDVSRSSRWEEFRFFVGYEAIKSLLNLVQNNHRSFHIIGGQVKHIEDEAWMQICMSFASLIFAAGLGIGVHFDMVLYELRGGDLLLSNLNNNGPWAVATTLAVLAIFSLVHSYAALEVSNIYAAMPKTNYVRAKDFNYLPKGSFLVGIAIAPMVCLAYTLLRAFASTLATLIVSGWMITVEYILNLAAAILKLVR